MNANEQAMFNVAQAHALGTSTAEQRKRSGVDALGHDSVQPWSAGELFPCVIATVERYQDAMHAPRCPLCPPEYVRSFELIAYGRREEYATREDAEKVARWLNRDPEGRKHWTARGWLVDGGAIGEALHVVGDFHGLPVYADEGQS